MLLKQFFVYLVLLEFLQLHKYIKQMQVYIKRYVTEPPGVVLLVDVTPGTVFCCVPALTVPCFTVLGLNIPVGNKPASDTVPPEVGVVGVELLGVVGSPTFNPAGKAIVNAPGVVGVTAFTPGVVGVVGVVTPGVSTPVTVRTVSVEGFFITLIACRICETFVHSRRPIAPKSFSYCSGVSGGRRVLSNTPGQCF